MDKIHILSCFKFFLLSTIFTATVFTQSLYMGDKNTNIIIQELILRNPEDCSAIKNVHRVGKSVDQYDISLQWSPYNCSNSNRDHEGFYCQQRFRAEDNFANVGKRLCVDVNGFKESIYRMNQFRLIIGDRKGTIKNIFIVTHLKPEGEPYYVCTTDTREHYITVTVEIMSAVQMCPKVLDFMFKNSVTLGSVSLQPAHPIVDHDMSGSSCRSSFQMPTDDSFIVKVKAGFAMEKCNFIRTIPVRYSYARACLTIKNVSRDFRCVINVGISVPKPNDDDEEVINFRVKPYESSCASFSTRYGSPLLFIHTYEMIFTCEGQFVLQADFRQTPPPDVGDDEEDSQSPNLYMAVFITLIAICLVCLGFTCLCCIRFRTKRLQRLQRRYPNNRPESPLPNQGFQNDASLDGRGVAWNSSQPGVLFGLPSYDDVVAECNGINPSDDSFKNELPPSYDVVCATTAPPLSTSDS